MLSVFKDLALALQDRGGASSDYQKTILDLETIAKILLELQSLQPAESNLSQTNSIRGQAQRMYHDVQEFLACIEQLNDKLGPRAARGFHRGTFAKIRWSQCFATKVKELRNTVHLQTTNIQTLLSLLIQRNQTSDRVLFESTFAKHSRDIETLAMLVKSMGITLRCDPRSAEEQLVDASQHVGISREGSFNGSGAENHNDRARVGSYAPAVSSDLNSAFAKQVETNLPIGNIQTGANTLKERQGLESTIDTYDPHTLSASITNSASHRLERRLDHQIMPFQDISGNGSLAFFNFLELKATIILPQVYGVVVAFLHALLSSFPHMILLLRLLRRMPRAVSLLCQDNIQFEDALGRMQSLQYQHFRHWTVFEACLRCTFKDTPGIQKVLQRQFVLKCHGAHEQILDATNWETYASPGMIVSMSISMSTILTPSGRCPRGCSAERTATSGSEARCTWCDLTFFVTHPPQTDLARSLKFIGNTSKPRSFREARIRKHVVQQVVNPKEYEKAEPRDFAASPLKAKLNIDLAEVSNLLRYESSYKEQEEHQLEEKEIVHFKRVHLVEDIVLKWTWTMGARRMPWYWAWHVELPEVRAEWKTASYWESVSPGLLNQIANSQVLGNWEDRRPQYISKHIPSFRPLLSKESAKQRAFEFSQDTPPTPILYQRMYTLIYTGPLSFSLNTLAIAKVPFVHLLAAQPLTPSRICYYFSMSKAQCDQLLGIMARDCPADPDKKELRELSYKELDVWGFPYPSERQRHGAIERSVQAFDVLRIDRHDNLWQRLLPVEQRGKGICLSKRGSD